MWKRILGRAQEDEPSLPAEPIAFKAIGVVRNNVKKPRRYGWEETRSTIFIDAALTDALDGLETYSHIIVIFYLDRVAEESRQLIHIHPRGDPKYPLQGVLATRTQARPNPIGVAVVPLLERAGNVLKVRALDAIDGTPVLDVKPYIPHYDSAPDARVPGWVMGRPDETTVPGSDEGRLTD